MVRTRSHSRARPNFAVDHPTSFGNPVDVLARVRLPRRPDERGSRVQDKPTYDAEFIGGFVSRRFLRI